MRRTAVSLLVCIVLALSVLVSGCSSLMPGQSTMVDATGSATGSYGYAPDYSYQGEQYLEITEQGVQYTAEQPTTTLSLKVDTAAYTNVKRFIESGSLPPFDAVRTEELVNYFSYDKQLPFDKDSPFAVYTEVGPSPFDPEKQLAFIRVKTEDIKKEKLPPSNLVFLIDTSGSMNSYDKLPLLQESFSMLVETLSQDDRVSIVTYAGDSKVVLKGVRGDDTRKINDAIFDLSSGGSTAGGKGIQTAYSLAQDYLIEGGNNRVILATDGDFNVGISDIDELTDFISDKRETGVYLSVLGFGTGNIRDDIMETLSKHGNGNYSYIDSLQTAKKVLVTEAGSHFYTVADDVKAQVSFNLASVKSYRLIGYENRMLANEDFDDDRKDAGEMGAGSDVVILFELELGSADDDLRFDVTEEDAGDLFQVDIRYKNPGEQKSRLLSVVANQENMPARNSTDFGFAASVALFGDLLRWSEPTAERMEGAEEPVNKLATARELASANLGSDPEGYRAEYLALLRQLENNRLFR